MNERAMSERVLLEGSDVNSSTLPFPLVLTIFSKVFVPERESEFALTCKRGVSVVVIADVEETVIDVSVSVPDETLASEHPLANCAAIVMMNVLNFRVVSDMENI